MFYFPIVPGRRMYLSFSCVALACSCLYTPIYPQYYHPQTHIKYISDSQLELHTSGLSPQAYYIHHGYVRFQASQRAWLRWSPTAFRQLPARPVPKRTILAQQETREEEEKEDGRHCCCCCGRIGYLNKRTYIQTWLGLNFQKLRQQCTVQLRD
jgi:hypothetical protein